MKNYIIILILIATFSCKNNQEETIKNNEKQSKVSLEETNDTIPLNQTNFKIEELYNVSLIGMELNENSKETNIYKKYSVDFTGACYSSDLCILKVNKENVTIINYYDDNISLKLKIKDSKLIDNGLILFIDNENLNEIKINKIAKDIPLYKLKIKGDLNIEDIRISNYLASKTSISKYGGIDCGDFDG